MNTFGLVKTILSQQLLNNLGTTITNTECDYYEDKRRPQRTENLFFKASQIKACLFYFTKKIKKIKIF